MFLTVSFIINESWDERLFQMANVISLEFKYINIPLEDKRINRFFNLLG